MYADLSLSAFLLPFFFSQYVCPSFYSTSLSPLPQLLSPLTIFLPLLFLYPVPYFTLSSCRRRWAIFLRQATCSILAALFSTVRSSSRAHRWAKKVAVTRSSGMVLTVSAARRRRGTLSSWETCCGRFVFDVASDLRGGVGAWSVEFRGVVRGKGRRK